jgi:translation initiation factor IF-2
LLDLVLLASDLLELVADPEAPAEGFVLESTQDAKRGASATLIIKDGTLLTGTFVVAGDAYAPVRFIENFLGKRIESAGPAEPVRVSGFSKLPDAGTPFTIAKNKKEAETHTQAALHNARAAAARAELPEGSVELPLVIKADVQGSLDAILHEIAKLHQENVVTSIIAAGVGSVAEGDVKAAAAAHATIITFNTSVDAAARELAERLSAQAGDEVAIESFSIIYELSEKITELMAARAPRVAHDIELGRGKIIKTFSSGAKRQVLGVRLISGTFSLGNLVKLVRRDIELARGKIANLQQARADVKEIRTEGDFGTEIECKEDAVPGDELVAFTLSAP